jgi:hypothetical protein
MLRNCAQETSFSRDRPADEASHCEALCAFLRWGRYIRLEVKRMSNTTQKKLKAKVVAKKAPRRSRRARRESANDLTLGFSSESKFGTRKRRKKKISAEESIVRIERLRRGDANNRIEGISSDLRSDAVFTAYINGEIEVTEIVPRLKLLYCVP